VLAQPKACCPATLQAWLTLIEPLATWRVMQGTVAATVNATVVAQNITDGLAAARNITAGLPEVSQTRALLSVGCGVVQPRVLPASLCAPHVPAAWHLPLHASPAHEPASHVIIASALTVLRLEWQALQESVDPLYHRVKEYMCVG